MNADTHLLCRNQWCDERSTKVGSAVAESGNRLQGSGNRQAVCRRYDIIGLLGLAADQCGLVECEKTRSLLLVRPLFPGIISITIEIWDTSKLSLGCTEEKQKMQGAAGRQIRKVRQSARHSWVLRDTLMFAGSYRAIDKVGRPGQPHFRASNPEQTTNKLTVWYHIIYQRSTLTVVRDRQKLCLTTRTSYPVVRWTSKISSPNENCNMLKKSKQLLPLAGYNQIIIETLCHFRPFHRTKHVLLIMSGMNSWGRDLSLSMLLLYKITDVEIHHAHVKIWFKIQAYKCCCCQEH